MINFPILTFHGTRLKFGMQACLPQRERKGSKTKERRKTKDKRNLIRWLHVISSCQIHTFKMLPLLLPPTLPLYQTKPSRLYFGLLFLGVNQNNNRVETSRRGSLLTTRMKGCQPTKPYCKEARMYVSANRKVRRKKLGSDLRKRNSNNSLPY
jgi:hypothetical protein